MLRLHGASWVYSVRANLSCHYSHHSLCRVTSIARQNSAQGQPTLTILQADHAGL